MVIQPLLSTHPAPSHNAPICTHPFVQGQQLSPQLLLMLLLALLDDANSSQKPLPCPLPQFSAFVQGSAPQAWLASP